jgi:hypothetical protein
VAGEPIRFAAQNDQNSVVRTGFRRSVGDFQHPVPGWMSSSRQDTFIRRESPTEPDDQMKRSVPTQ